MIEMTEENDPIVKRIDQIKYAIEKVGLPILMIAFFAFVSYYTLFVLGYKVDRCIRNTRAIMQKMGIPIIVADDKWNGEKK